MNRLSRLLVAGALLAGAREAAAVAQLPLAGVQGNAAGHNYTCAIASGAAWCWGSNSDGQLGNGTTVDRGSPTPVLGLSAGVAAIATGYAHTCAMLASGVKCWGYGQSGELGNNASTSSPTPVAVIGLPVAPTAITAGGFGTGHTCALVNGAAWCWGANFYGETGNGEAGFDGGPLSQPAPGPVIGLGAGVTAIAAGGRHTCAVAGNAALCWGDNYYGTLGNGQAGYNGGTDHRATPGQVMDLASGVTAIAAGLAHACAIVDGGAKCWGSGSDGELGNGQTDFVDAVPVPVTGLGSGVTAIAAGMAHSCALLDNDPAHPVKCWGSNAHGQLGNGSNTNSSSPVSVSFPFGGSFTVNAISAGSSHTCAQITIGGQAQMYCWGDNGSGELAVSNGGASFVTKPVSVTSISTATVVEAGGENTCAVVAGGAQCWGYNYRGELGNDNAGENGGEFARATPGPVKNLGSGSPVLAIGADDFDYGTGHTCALLNGAAQCWGYNGLGELGNGSTTDSAAPVAVTGLDSAVSAIAAGFEFSCAAVAGSAQCWGWNYFGQLGNGQSGGNAGTYYVPGPVMNLASGVSAIAAGAFHTCAIVNGGAQCWGSNMWGELGNGQTSMAPELPASVLNLGSGVVALAAGGDIRLGLGHTCALVNNDPDHPVKCWGNNQFGQLGSGDTSDSPVPVDVVFPAIGSFTVQSIAVGGGHACAALTAGGQKSLYCWGANERGQLGDGTRTNHVLPVQVAGLASGVLSVATGNRHSCAVLPDGAMKCWGDDTHGQLGDGRYVGVALPQRVVMADVILRDGFE